MHFENNTDSFRAALAEIKEFAVKIGSDHFAALFRNAMDILSGDLHPEKPENYALPPIPEDHMPIFRAADMADVFGGMGSWNDDPGGMAFDQGMSAEYEALSDELLRQLRQAVLYAVNEW